MCLARVIESYDIPSTMIMDGWKKFGGTSAKPLFDAYKWNGQNEVPLDKWITATGENAKTIHARDGNTYEPGFHVFADETELKPLSSYRRVFVRNVTCMGDDDGNGRGGKKVIIARQMFVPSDPNGWPPKDEKPASGGGSKRSNPIKKFIDKTMDDMKAKGITPGQA